MKSLRVGQSKQREQSGQSQRGEEVQGWHFPLQEQNIKLAEMSKEKEAATASHSAAFKLVGEVLQLTLEVRDS